MNDGKLISLKDAEKIAENLRGHKFKYCIFVEGKDKRLELDVEYATNILPDAKADGVLVVKNSGHPFLIAFRQHSFGVDGFHSSHINPALERDLRKIKKALIREIAGSNRREYVVSILHCLKQLRNIIMSNKLEKSLNRRWIYFFVGFALTILLSSSPVLAEKDQSIVTLSSWDKVIEPTFVALLVITAAGSILLGLLGAKLLGRPNTSRFQVMVPALVIPAVGLLAAIPVFLIVGHVGVTSLFLICLNAAVFLGMLSLTLKT